MVHPLWVVDLKLNKEDEAVSLGFLVLADLLNWLHAVNDCKAPPVVLFETLPIGGRFGVIVEGKVRAWAWVSNVADENPQAVVARDDRFTPPSPPAQVPPPMRFQDTCKGHFPAPTVVPHDDDPPPVVGARL